MKYVLESNVALKWVLRENNSDKARQLRIDYQQKITNCWHRTSWHGSMTGVTG